MIDALQETRKPQAPSRRPAFSPSKLSSPAEAAAASQATPPSAESALARKACVVAFRSGEAVHRHPELRCYLDEGWDVESAVPQLADAEHVELLVVLSRHGNLEALAADV